MNVLFLTLLSFDSIQEKNIYTDLLREFVKNGHYVYTISPIEKRQHKNTHLIKEKNSKILRLKIGNTQKMYTGIVAARYAIRHQRNADHAPEYK